MGDTKVICRFCLNDENAIEYFNVFDVSPDFIMKIKNCLSVQLIQNDGFSIFGCLECVQKIHQFDNFKKMCRDSYEYLVQSRRSEHEKTEESLCKSINSNICMDNNEQQLEEIENDNFSNDSEESGEECNYSEYQVDSPSSSKLNKNTKQLESNEVDDSVGN